jgi:subtilase family serine protease
MDFAYGNKNYQWVTYTIQSGDTLSGIAYKTLGDGTANGYNFIAQYNGISNPSYIYSGQKIYIPQQVAPKPDLIVQYQSGTNSVTTGGTVSLSSYVTNSGAGAAGYSYTKYWLSNDTTLDSNDTFIDYQYVSPLNSGYSQYNSYNFTYNSNWGTGTKYVLFQADGYGYVSESNEYNNVAYATIFVNPLAKPDLIITNPTAPSSVMVGNSVTVGAYVKNNGNASAGSSYVGYWLSNDTTLDSSDTYINSGYISSLSAGSSQYNSWTFAYNSSWGTGTKYVLFEADSSGGFVAESNESNNVSYATIFVSPPPKPDLTITGQTATNSVTVGSTVSISAATKNNGNAIAGTSTTKYWLSNDATLDSNDIALGSQTINSLNAGASQSASLNFTYNSSWTTGTKYILFQADSGSVVAESNESNNIAYATIFVSAPDLIITGQTATIVGSTVNISATTKNNGNAVAGASTTKYWLSNDTNLDSSDVSLSIQTINSLSAGASQSAGYSFAYNSTWGTGTKYVLFQTDGTNAVAESNESNNVAYAAIYVPPSTPDLSIISQTAPSAVTFGSTVSISAATKNSGNASAVGSTTKYWLSNDATLDITDITIGSQAINSLSAGASQSASLNFTYNSSWGTGTKYILFQADSGSVVSESNEFNNVAYATIFVSAPDLIITGQTATIVGSSVNISATTKNNGNASAGTSNTKYWLSNDTTLDSTDISLNTQAIASLSAGASQSASYSFAYNSSWGTGTKYILFQADSTNAVAESNESNNVAYTTIVVTPPPTLKPDLIITGQTATSTVTFGGTVSISSATKNNGNASAVGSTTKYWLSNDTTLDSSDVSLNTQAIASLSAGASQSASYSFVYNNSSWGTGTKYILFQADSGSVVAESNESNNVAYATIFVNGKDWYDQNLKDAGLISLTRSLATDGNLSRNDMISIFQNAEDGSTVDSVELTDFRTIISNSVRFTMADSVKVLSDKIANGSVANIAAGFGNLNTSGSNATQMENLIGKWFLGTDHPDAYSLDGTTQYQYRLASGSLYQQGISYQDISQGNLGDCYFLAGLAGVALRSPSAIQNMIEDNKDGTYTVRFYNKGVADYVTVDSQLPTDASGHFVYASRDNGMLYNNPANELWVALAEKAYAQMNESSWIGQDNTNAYQTRDPNYASNNNQNYTGINGGWSDDVFKQITNNSTVPDWSLTDSDRTNIINQFNAGHTVFMNWEGHALTLVGYNSTTQQFSIYNPWGTLYSLTWSQILNGSYDYDPWSFGTQSGEKFVDWSYSV